MICCGLEAGRMDVGVGWMWMDEYEMNIKIQYNDFHHLFLFFETKIFMAQI
jgi:hypothetical protein